MNAGKPSLMNMLARRGLGTFLVLLQGAALTTALGLDLFPSGIGGNGNTLETLDLDDPHLWNGTFAWNDTTSNGAFHQYAEYADNSHDPLGEYTSDDLVYHGAGRGLQQFDFEDERTNAWTEEGWENALMEANLQLNGTSIPEGRRRLNKAAYMDLSDDSRLCPAGYYCDVHDAYPNSYKRKFLVTVGNSGARTKDATSKSFNNAPISGWNSKVISCPAEINKGNWFGGFRYPDRFKITVGQDTGKITAYRLDHNGGWGMGLSFYCYYYPKVKKACPAGKYSKMGQTSASGCKPCEEGHWCGFSTTIEARYIYIYDIQEHLTLNEVQVYDGNGVELTIAAASQGEGTWGGHHASLCKDGNKRTTCISGSSKPGQWLEMDLGVVVSISKVAVTNYHGAPYFNRILGAKIGAFMGPRGTANRNGASSGTQRRWVVYRHGRRCNLWVTWERWTTRRSTTVAIRT